MQNASAKKNIRVKLYDFDGCLLHREALKNYNFNNDGVAGKKNWVIEQNQIFFEQQLNELQALQTGENKVTEIIIASGTNRQDYFQDESKSNSNMSMNMTWDLSPSCFPAFEDIKNYFKNEFEDIRVSLETFLLYDIGLAQDQHGQHFKDAIEFSRNFKFIEPSYRDEYIENILKSYNSYNSSNPLTEEEEEKQKQKLKCQLQLIARWNKLKNIVFPTKEYLDNISLLSEDEQKVKLELINTWYKINNLPPVSYNNNAGITITQRRAVFDSNKIILLYAQAHKVASQNPDALITIDFYDANENILKNLKTFYELYKALLPANVHINFYQYDDRKIAEKSLQPNFHITGEGQIDSSYNQTLFQFFKDHIIFAKGVGSINYELFKLNESPLDLISRYRKKNQLRNQIKPSNIFKSTLIVFGITFLIGVITVASGGIAPLSVFGLTAVGLGLAALKPLAVALIWTIANAFVCGLVGGAMTALVGSVMMGIQKIMGYAEDPTPINTFSKDEKKTASTVKESEVSDTSCQELKVGRTSQQSSIPKKEKLSTNRHNFLNTVPSAQINENNLPNANGDLIDRIKGLLGFNKK